MTVSEVAKILDAGKRAGCTEALFTFEEMPEEHSEFREWIEDIRYSSVIDYLIDLCKIAIDCGMLPHSNPDVLESRDIRRALAAQCKHGADGRVYTFTEIVTGDPNHDGAVNAAGGVIALQVVAGAVPAALVGDMIDGKVASLDALMIMQVAAGVK